MCGIVGSFLFHPSAHLDLQSCCQQMANQLLHRGPDAQQVIDLGPVQLGHTRLSIIDLQNNAKQPMSCENRRYWLTYNGEIYNYLELRAALERAGQQFRTNSDTEVVLRAFMVWKNAALEKFTGMFALALWDRETQTLLLARDRMGEKPLFYSAPQQHQLENAGIIFSSELNALIQHPCIDQTINPHAINQYLSLNYILTNQCIYKNVMKLPPAHYLTISKQTGAQLHCYWALSHYFNHPNHTITAHQAANTCRELLQNATKQQMRSDVPLGAFLSGGIDSSAITAAMTTCNLSSNKVKTYSIDFNYASFNETPFSQQVASLLQTEHATRTVDINTTEDIIHALRCYGEPFADTSAIPCYYLAQYARQFVTVCLSGDGGDELFAGYDTYLADALLKKIRFFPKSGIRLFTQLINRYLPASHRKISFDYKFKQFLYGAQYDFQRAHYSWREIFSEQEKRQLCRPALLQAFSYDPYEDYRLFFKEVQNCDPLNQFLYVDMKTWLVDDILVKVDRSSMAHSLEVRAPFLNHQLVEFVASLPAHFKLRKRTTKYLLKKSQAQALPHDIIYRKKRGFNAPISHWLFQQLQPLCQTILFNDTMQHYFNASFIQQLLDQHYKKRADNSFKLFGLLSLGLWLTQHAN